MTRLRSRCVGEVSWRHPVRSRHRSQLLERVSAAADKLGSGFSVTVYGNTALSRDVDLWIEGDREVAMRLEALLARELLPIDVSGPWSAPGDVEWVAAGRWSASQGLLVAGPPIPFQEGMTRERCVRAYQRRLADSAAQLLEYARHIERSDHESAGAIATSALRSWLRSGTVEAAQWRTVNHLADHEVRDEVADSLCLPRGGSPLTLAGLAVDHDATNALRSSVAG